jgi:hypothetical protein
MAAKKPIAKISFNHSNLTLYSIFNLTTITGLNIQFKKQALAQGKTGKSQNLNF